MDLTHIPTYGGLWLLISAITLFSFVPMWAEGRFGAFRLLTCKNILILGLWVHFALWPAWVLLAGYQQLTLFPLTFFGYRYKYAVLGLTWTLCGLAAFHALYYMARNRRTFGIRDPAFKIRMGRLVAIMSLLSLVAGICFLSLASRAASVWEFIENIDDFRVTELRGTSPLYFGMTFMFMVFLVTCITSLRGDIPKIWSALTLAATVVMGFAAAYRHMAVQAVITWLVLQYYFTKKVQPWKLWVMVIIFLSANIWYVAFRVGRGDVGKTLHGDTTWSRIIFDNLLGRFHGTESVARIVEATNETGYDGGQYYLKNLLVFWVPRQLWDAKPDPLGAIINVTFFPELYHDLRQTGASITSLIGALYWIGGPYGVCIGMAFLGFWCGRADDSILRNPSFINIGVYVNVFVFFLFVNEGLDLHLPRLLITLVQWWLVAILCEQTGAVRTVRRLTRAAQNTSRHVELKRPNIVGNPIVGAR